MEKVEMKEEEECQRMIRSRWRKRRSKKFGRGAKGGEEEWSGKYKVENNRKGRFRARDGDKARNGVDKYGKRRGRGDELE